jgi:hypothetical protein
MLLDGGPGRDLRAALKAFTQAKDALGRRLDVDELFPSSVREAYLV